MFENEKRGVKTYYISKINLEKQKNEIFMDIKEQVSYYKYYNHLYVREKTKNKKLKIYLLIIWMLCLILFFAKWYSDIFSVITLIVSIYLISQRSKNNKIINNYLSKRDYRKMILNFPDNMIWNQLKTDDKIRNDEFFNIKSNVGYFLDATSNMLVLLPFLAIEINDNNIKYYCSKELIKMFRYNSKVGEYSKMLDYKYKKLEYERWQYQRKDGHRDRRYSNNKLFKYYRIWEIRIRNLIFEIPNKQVYDNLLSSWILNIKDAIISYELPNKNNINNLSDVEAYLKDKNMPYNHYGETIEFEKNGNTYIVNNKGELNNSNKKLLDILGERYEQNI